MIGVRNESIRSYLIGVELKRTWTPQILRYRAVHWSIKRGQFKIIHQIIPKQILISNNQQCNSPSQLCFFLQSSLNMQLLNVELLWTRQHANSSAKNFGAVDIAIIPASLLGSMNTGKSNVFWIILAQMKPDIGVTFI